MSDGLIITKNYTLFRGDCAQYLATIGRVDTLVMDPPYEFKTSGGGRMRAERKCLDQIADEGLDQGFDFQIINPLLYRSAVVFCHNDQLHRLLPHMAGLYSRHALLFWHKKNPIPVANKNYLPDVEPYIHAWNDGGHPLGSVKPDENGLKTKSRIIQGNNGKSKLGHPTVKPDYVMDKIMANVNGETVLDPFMGTGSTGVAALRSGKKFIGIERDEKYFLIAKDRLAAAEKEISKKKKIVLTAPNQ